ncbi:S1 domain-containing RNA-binding protein [Fodinisporobacter ferrooxydans]|uniref:S1 domain-containing RNA-binding protein n=1 Tax=Fodinisporobacter ferrooxydans TaxID=2901836 RepID=A0ABY4CMW3_9BACL|nr:S1 domain-containing RNA-binding protein [Alicyclobacillaceae bacterium MYW30-H2]
MSIELGSKLEGKVTGITNFGAFVLLPSGVTGLVHISEIADTYVKNIHEHLKVNDPVTVKVINVDKDGKIGLSIRQALPQFENAATNREHHRPHREPRERSNRSSKSASKVTFDDKLSRFLKDSEERLQALKRSEAKRGGRGGRRG